MTFNMADGFRQGCPVPALAFVWLPIIKYQHGTNLGSQAMNSGLNKCSSVMLSVAEELEVGGVSPAYLNSQMR